MTPAPWHLRMVRKHGQSAVLYAALALSAPGEFSLAILAGWDWRVAWLMPAVMSMYAAIGARIAKESKDVARKLRAQPGEADAKRKAGRATRGALYALFGATAAQITEHILTTGAKGPTAYVVIVVSAVPPLVAAHVLHIDPPEDAEPAADAAPLQELDEPAPAPAWKPEINKVPAARAVLPRKGLPKARPNEWLTIPEAAKRAGVAASTLYRRRVSSTNPLRVREEGGRQLVLWSDVAPVNALI
ncbi:hypothetical protein [Kitasatospora sp. NPDC050543]|uniref:hypothetical protein n=1 Tax=Kitasatospora sp. NPDC050543 TaxID=3364054 RepID=UPI0037B30222